MAEVHIERTNPAVSRTGFRLSWGAIFAGLVIALLIQVVLTLIGIAFGVGALSGDANPETVGYGAIAWMLLTVLLALFAGGMATGRLAGVLRQNDGMLHGVLLGGLSTMFMLWMVMGGIGTIVGGAFGTLQRTAAADERVRQSPVAALEQRAGMPVDTMVERAGSVVQDAAPHVATGALVAALVILASVGAAVGGVATTARD